MTQDIPGLEARPNMQKRFRALVVNREDPELAGRIGVHIAELFPESDPQPGGTQPTKTSLPKTIFENQKDLSLPPFVKEDNYIWARPAAFRVDGENVGGRYVVPEKGTLVSVWFEDGDIKKAFWEDATPTTKGVATPGANIGKASGFAKSTDHWKDPVKKPAMEVLREFANGSIVYADMDEETNGIVVEWSNGHRLAIHAGTEASGVYILTEKGHTVHLDDTSKQITIKTQTGKCQAVMDDGDGSIKFSAEGDISATAKGNAVIEVQGTLNVKSEGEMTVESSASIAIKAPTVNVN